MLWGEEPAGWSASFLQGKARLAVACLPAPLIGSTADRPFSLIQIFPEYLLISKDMTYRSAKMR